jgi:hypothetical protein
MQKYNRTSPIDVFPAAALARSLDVPNTNPVVASFTTTTIPTLRIIISNSHHQSSFFIVILGPRPRRQDGGQGQAVQVSPGDPAGMHATFPHLISSAASFHARGKLLS